MTSKTRNLRESSAVSGRKRNAARSPPIVTKDHFVVGVGASAGGLEACSKLLDVLPADSGMAFIFVLHLDPNHDSLLVELLSRHTGMAVKQVTYAVPVEPNHVYIIAPDQSLSVDGGFIRPSKPLEPHGSRMPVDLLLQSIATNYGSLGIALILSGTGSDGSIGVRAVQKAGGFVIAQDPKEAEFDGMPSSAIATGSVDRTLTLAEIPSALASYVASPSHAPAAPETTGEMASIIELLRSQTTHNFTAYKPGTLRRRIERRMAMASHAPHQMGVYLQELRGDAAERDRLASDLLINVTSFFRDTAVFDRLASTTIPEMVRDHPAGQPLRVWIAGCSTGEEAYSLAILFSEAIARAERPLKLQVFASDVDAEAVAYARQGVYPLSIAVDLDAARLAKFFEREEHGYKITSELRSLIVYTVQDLLSDPPFSHLDFISCRNLLIYMKPEAQAKIILLFHFALREGGVLLLGNAETIGAGEGRFQTISKADRIYRHIGRARPGDLAFALQTAKRESVPSETGGPAKNVSRSIVIAELCRRLVLKHYSPAAVLIDNKHDVIYSLGPTDRYLKMPAGHPTHNVLALVRQELRSTLRSAILSAQESHPPETFPAAEKHDPEATTLCRIEAMAIVDDGEPMTLVCFLDEPDPLYPKGSVSAPDDASVVERLECELRTARADLRSAIDNLETAGDDQKAINDEALSRNEEYQSTNEELLTSKEELQSLNEELAALNGQLQETLERQRTTSNDLQNVLYSTDLATLFLDKEFNIRLFTPATELLFPIRSSDIGRPLRDLNSLASDTALLDDAESVLAKLSAVEREVEGQSGVWYLRRILPYRTSDQTVDGVVITFTDITERRRVGDALEKAKRDAELANAAKSRFLAAASHDLRQPLQTLALLQGLLARTIHDEKGQTLITRLEETVNGMSGMLGTLLDINQIEAGAIQPDRQRFQIGKSLDRIKDEFTYHAIAKGLTLRVLPCSLVVETDPYLLDQILRNLFANAIKYTARGKVLIGCRRLPGRLRIEVWDTGIGIAADQIDAVFEEYHQVDNKARERSRGLGLGLAIVARLAALLDHKIGLRSWLGKQSVFSIEVPTASSRELAAPGTRPGIEGVEPEPGSAGRSTATGAILIVEDDPEIGEFLELVLTGEGHSVTLARDGLTAVELVSRGLVRPDLVLADYNLPGELSGLEAIARLRSGLNHRVPAIVLTGDMSASTLARIIDQNCIALVKPVTFSALNSLVRETLPAAPLPAGSTNEARAADGGRERPKSGPIISVIDDDLNIRTTMSTILCTEGWTVKLYPSCEAFLEQWQRGQEGCLLVDVHLPGFTSGLDLVYRLRSTGEKVPTIFITGDHDIAVAVAAIRAGAFDFIVKPIVESDLIASVKRALYLSHGSAELVAWGAAAVNHLAGLTTREREVMQLVLEGHPNKNIAADLGISQRTVETHRASVMKKSGAHSIPALARLALAAVNAESAV